MPKTTSKRTVQYYGGPTLHVGEVSSALGYLQTHKALPSSVILWIGGGAVMRIFVDGRIELL